MGRDEAHIPQEAGDSLGEVPKAIGNCRPQTATVARFF